MHDPIVIERSTLLALISVLQKEIKRSSRLADLATDPDVKALHREATLQLCTLDCLVAEEVRSLLITEEIILAPFDMPPEARETKARTLYVQDSDDTIPDDQPDDAPTGGVEDTHALEIADALNNHGQDPKPSEGWTGKKCPSCKGTGFKYSPGHDNETPCGACGGTGEEYGDLGPGGCDDPLMQ